ncbi:flagellar hook-basal body complex protein FliE [Myxococcota bacterium]|nr:flagellar hook-basal body complex protein FliE [Myxococcota bacterium]
MRIPSDPARFLQGATPATGAAPPGGALGEARPSAAAGGGGFADRVLESVRAVNEKQGEAGEAAMAMVTGQDVGIHEAMIALEEAGLAFKLMVQVRNKAIEAYQEVMRTQV